MGKAGALDDKPAAVNAGVGLDVGNTSCSIALHRNGVLDLVPNEQGSRSTPSCVAFNEVETLLGEAAQAQAARNAANTIKDLLRLLGRSYADDGFAAEAAKWRFAVSASAKDGGAHIDVSLEGKPKSFAPPRLLSLLLARLRADAESFSGEPVKEVVLGCPAHFDAAQRAALKEAAQMGGMRVRQVLSHPLALALLAMHGQPPPPPTPAAAAASRPMQILVVDVGGSSSSASVVERAVLPPRGAAAPAAAARPAAVDLSDASGADAEPAAEPTAGDEAVVAGLSVRASVTKLGLGGRQLDAALRAQVCKEVRRRQRIDLSDNVRAMARLLDSCELAKISLTSSAQATVGVEADGMDYFAKITRAKMDELATPFANSAAELAEKALARAGLTASQVDILVPTAGAFASHLGEAP